MVCKDTEKKTFKAEAAASAAPQCLWICVVLTCVGFISDHHESKKQQNVNVLDHIMACFSTQACSYISCNTSKIIFPLSAVIRTRWPKEQML